MRNRLSKISIITPSFNQGQFLEETIQSVINQDYPNFEYIVIDGGSNDNSVEIIKKYEDKISYWVSEKDNGQADAINKGFKKASGNILHWLNSDDILIPGSLTLVAKYFSENPDIGCVFGDLELIDAKGKYLATRKAVPFHFKTALHSACLVPQPSTLFKRIALEKTGDLNVNYNYQLDYEYFLRMASAGVKFGIIKKPLAKFRLHEKSKTVSEYKKSFFASEFEIKASYITGRFKKRNIILKALKIVYKARMYFVRILTRGDLVPFKTKMSRESI